MDNPIAGYDEPRGQDHLPLPYYASTERATAPLDEVRRRIPGWGVDLDYDERSAVPMEDYDPGATGAHWTFPERQPERWPRERSPEHGILPPVFGTACPPRGISGAIRKYAYTLGEGKSSHWLLLMAADRVDVLESSLESALKGRPDNPLTETGVIAELKRHGLRSRIGKHRADVPRFSQPSFPAVHPLDRSSDEPLPRARAAPCQRNAATASRAAAKPPACSRASSSPCPCWGRPGSSYGWRRSPSRRRSECRSSSG